ncbi:sulfatase [Paludisphaera rhizosphaerae]|uniref:sulfatase n=1 Tax=Paludisphaera rhizosphaerae TaxID=2711216 RepID=UPI0013EA92A2|nr:sulfatase [Paludisphaera rhizosphaerae]
MLRRFILPIVLALAAVAAEVRAADVPDTSKMNVLLIDIEDCNAGVWGCYGNTICKTPNIDRFAKSAVVFDAAYVQAVSCNPSRTSFLTGLRPPTTGVTTNEQVMDEHLPPGTLSLPEILKTGGFTTANVGKLFHQTNYAEKRLLTFDRLEFIEKPKDWKGPPPILQFPAAPRVSDPPPADRNSREFRVWRRKQSDRYGDSGLTREQERDYRMAATAAALIKQFARDKSRFFLSVSQSKPHTPLIAPKKYIDMYDPDKIPTPPAAPDEFVGLPAHYQTRAHGGNPDIFTEKQPTPQQAREAIAAYYACVSFVDDNIGLVLDALDEAGLRDNTIVVFLGDHGFHLGDHAFWSKYSMLEPTRRAPLIVRVPGAVGNGRVSRQFVEFVDLLPTIGDLAAVKLPTNLEGTSFSPLLNDPERPWKSAVFMSGGSRDHGRMVRNRRYSYLEFQEGSDSPALFDLEKDPWETRNVIDEPAYAETRRELAALLQAGWKAALPPEDARKSARD